VPARVVASAERLSGAWPVSLEKKALAGLVKRARAKKGLTTRELASRMGVSQQRVIRMENNADISAESMLRAIEQCGLRAYVVDPAEGL
jgi:transcriptional regulator with XRE-family HTH domain